MLSYFRELCSPMEGNVWLIAESALSNDKKESEWKQTPPKNLLFIYLGSLFIFVVMGLELRAYTLSHSTSPFLWWVFSR
jgi:hypothetical protein